MKIRLSVGQIPYSGYLNVDPMPKAQGDQPFDVEVRDIKNLDGIVNDAECYEILVDGSIGFINGCNMEETLVHWMSKLRHGGKIIINGYDAIEVCKTYLNANMSTVEFNHIMFGDQSTAWCSKSGCIPLHELVDIFKRHGLKIIKKRLDGIEMSLEVQRV